MFPAGTSRRRRIDFLKTTSYKLFSEIRLPNLENQIGNRNGNRIEWVTLIRNDSKILKQADFQNNLKQKSAL